MRTSLFTDHYELTMLQAALESGAAHRPSVFEAFARRLPEGRRYGVVAGTGRVLEGLADFRFDDEQLRFLSDNKVVNAETIKYLENFRFTGNILTAVSGFVLPEKSVAAAGEPMSAVTALTLLLQSRSTSGAIASAVTAITPAYVLESTPAAPLALTPVWRISTDTYEYYVNCASRAVSHN